MFSHLKNLNILNLSGNHCVNIIITGAAAHMAEIEAALRDCTISYLSLENDELKKDLQGLKESISEDLKKLKETLNVK
jgi:hypothetical protein